MNEGRKSKALIIGAGIGGLTTGIALQQAGYDVKIFERANAIREIGAGLSIWTNAVLVLQQLGLGEALQSISIPLTSVSFYTPQGKLLTGHDLKPLQEKFGAASVMIHRADLQKLLLDTLGQDRIQLYSECSGFTQNEPGVQAKFSDGWLTQGDILIGADGLHSVVRAQLFGKIKPRYAGYPAWRGVTQFEHSFLTPGKAFETWGRGVRFGAAPLSQGRVYWYITANMPEGSSKKSRRELQELCEGWHPPIQSIIQATAESVILQNDIYDRDPLPRWGNGLVTLLGDAAHPTTPNMGQGACQAIEDALILSKCLRNAEDKAAALRSYEALRIPHTNAIVKQSRRIGTLGNLSNPLICWLRDLAMRYMPASMQTKQIEWPLRFQD